jgi:riboflavin synthase
MFTGIIERIGNVKNIERQGTNISFWIESPLAPELKIDQSVSHNGVCLTVEAVRGNQHKVTAIEETLTKSNLGSLQIDSPVNLERCMTLNGRLDGHIVQGHVDTVAECLDVVEKEGSWELVFTIPGKFSALIIEKGSISLNGISLTIFDITLTTFKVAVIPYTYHHTNISAIKKGQAVNIEFDLIGKYVSRFKEVHNL